MIFATRVYNFYIYPLALCRAYTNFFGKYICRVDQWLNLKSVEAVSGIMKRWILHYNLSSKINPLNINLLRGFLVAGVGEISNLELLLDIIIVLDFSRS